MSPELPDGFVLSFINACGNASIFFLFAGV
jgi:hypothetical protein